MPAGGRTSFWLTTRTVTVVVCPAGREAGEVTVTGAQTPPSHWRSKEEYVMWSTLPRSHSRPMLGLGPVPSPSGVSVE